MPPSDQEPRYRLVDSNGNVVGALWGDGNGNVKIADETDTQTIFGPDGISTPALDADSATVNGTTTTDALEATSASVDSNDNLTETVANGSDRILGGARWYIIDEFGDNNLQNRDNPVTAQCVSAFDGRLGDARYRPEWSINSGSPSASQDALSLPVGDSTKQEVSLTSDIKTAQWAFEVNPQSDPTTGNIQSFLVGQSDGLDVIKFVLSNDGVANLIKVDGGTTTTLISGTWSGNSDVANVLVTRDRTGTWELIINGSSQGTASDGYLPNTQTFKLSNTTDSDMLVDKLAISPNDTRVI